MKFAWSNTEKYDSCDVVLVGVPDESGSHSDRKGSSKAPDMVRKISNERDVFERGGSRITTATQTGGISKKVFDYGNIKKKDVSDFSNRVLKNGKFMVTVGGDHSVTTEVLKGMDRSGKKISVVYFDSHPDFICSSRDYYGSVVCDISEYKNIDFSSSVEVGIRQPEPEELANIRRKNLETILPITVADKGIGYVVDRIKKRVGDNVYVSVDVDVLDPAFAPAASTPVPGGLSSVQMIYMMKELAKLNLVGMDVLEICPKYDVQDMTSHFAARMIAETIASLK